MFWLTVVALALWSLAGGLASAQSEAPAAQPAPPSEGGTLIAPTGQKEAALWRRLREVQANIPTGEMRAVPFASVKAGSGPSAVISQVSKIGGSFRVAELAYTMDGRELSVEKRDHELAKSKRTVFEGRMLPGRHELRVEATIRGHGYGIFSYMKAYRIRLAAAQSFDVRHGSTAQVHVVLKEDTSAPMRRRFSLSFKVANATAAMGQPAAVAPVAPTRKAGLAPL